MRSRTSAIALAIAAVLPSVASAFDFSFNGFSTAAYAQTDTDDAQVGYQGQPDGIDSSGSMKIDSKLGIQLTGKFNDMFSATVQGVAYTDLAGDWEPRLDWAYLRVQPLSSITMRAGYMRTPTFMYSDSVFIGYANTSIRPPLEVYNISPVYQLRGVDVTWRGNIGPVSVSINPFYGDSEVDLPGYTLDVPEWLGAVSTVEYKSFMARIGYTESELGPISAVAPLVGALRAIPSVFCAPCASEADQIDTDGVVVKTTSLGAQYDDGANFVAAEYAHSRSGGHYVVPDRTGAYLTYGRRFGGFMPYATYAIGRRDSVERSDAIPAVGPFAALNFGVNATIDQGPADQDTVSFGMRYELPAFAMLNAAVVKLQVDHIDSESGGALNNVTPGFDDKLNMYSISFDFLF